MGRICAPVSLFVPAYLIAGDGRLEGAARACCPAAAVCGVAFAGTQFVVSNFVGPQLTDILGSLAAIGSLVLLFLVWKPKDHFTLEGDDARAQCAEAPSSCGELVLAWAPYVLLVVFVLLWGIKPVETSARAATFRSAGRDCTTLIQRMPPVVAKPTPYAAAYTLQLAVGLRHGVPAGRAAAPRCCWACRRGSF